MRRLALLLALLMSLGLLVAPPASAWEPRGGAVFNKPPPWGKDQEPYTIVKTVEEAIRNVPEATAGQPKPEILVTSYLLDRNASVNSMIAACRRGVSVRVILDKGIVIDAYARRIVGWRVSRNAEASFVLDALEQAIHARRPAQGGGLIHHSDRGSQYLSIRYTERPGAAGIAPSVGSVGDAYDCEYGRAA